MKRRKREKALDRSLSPLDVWVMAFGVMVGWGAFAMPGNTFLPVAGPAGTLISMFIGTAIMWLGKQLAGKQSVDEIRSAPWREALPRAGSFSTCPTTSGRP